MGRLLVKIHFRFVIELRAFGLLRVPLRPLRGSGFALGQPDAFGAGAFPLRRFAPYNGYTCVG